MTREKSYTPVASYEQLQQAEAAMPIALTCQHRQRPFISPITNDNKTDEVEGAYSQVRHQLFGANDREWPGGAVFAFQVETEGWGERPFNTSAFAKKARGVENGRFQPPVLVLRSLMTRRLGNGIGWLPDLHKSGIR